MLHLLSVTHLHHRHHRCAHICGYGTRLEREPHSAEKLSAKVVRLLRLTGVAGGTARLRVSTEAGSKYSRYAITITNKKGQVVAKLDRPVTSTGRVQTIEWRVPKALKAQTLTYSVVAYGPGVASSAKVTASLQIKAPVSRKATTRR